MRTSALLFLLLGMLAAGCSSDGNKKLEEIADRACACTDPACAQKIVADLAAWKKEFEGKSGDNERAQKAAGRITSCLMKSSGLGKMGEKMMEKGMGAAGKAMDEAAKAVDQAGKAAGEAGKAADEAGKMADEAGKMADEAGKRADEAGKAAGEAGKAAGEAGKAAGEAAKAAGEARKAAGQ